MNRTQLDTAEWLSLLFTSLPVLLSTPVLALPYTFTQIAGSTPQFDRASALDLNDSGMVAYVVTNPTASISKLYYGDGSNPPVLVAGTGDVVGSQTFGRNFGLADINNSNAVTFAIDFANAIPGGISAGIYTKKGNTLTQIDVGTGSIGNPIINNSDEVIFSKPVGRGIFVASPSLTNVATVGTTYNGFGSVYGINDSGTVAFAASLTSGSGEIRTSSPPYASTTTIASGSFGVLTPINNSGFVFYVENASGISTLYLDDGTNRVLIADTGGAQGFRGFNWWDLNDFNDVAFAAGAPGLGGGIGIYTGPNSVTDKVIAPGDTLFGKQVVDLALGGINNLCQVSFSAHVIGLGGSVVSEAYRADPQFPCGTNLPEPATLALLGLGLAGLGFSRRKQ